MILASIPSPPTGVWQIGPVPIRGYALCILLGIVVAVIITDRRLRGLGVRQGAAADIATWAVPFGLVGARLYHLATSWQLYWGRHGQGTVAALEVWHGGLGIWGGVALGALGGWIGARRAGISLSTLSWAAAPAIPAAQAVGRWGNYFNQELYGRATSKSLPWALHITHDPAQAGHFYYQPTFLYESIWDLGTAALVAWAARRWRLSGERAFALYVMAYTAGRAWIEALRIDTGDPHPLGIRFNDWTSIVLFIAALALFVVRRKAPPPQRVVDADEPEATSGSGEEPSEPPARTLNA